MATIYVAPTGRAGAAGTEAAPLKTIAQGLAKMKAGDTVLLKAGTYAERVWMDKGGTAAAWSTLRGEPGAIVAAPASADGVLMVRSAYWIIDGLEITGSGGAGVDVSDTHHVIVRNCEPHHCGGSGLAGYQADAVLFEGNHVHHNAGSSGYHTSGISLAAMRTLAGDPIEGSWRCIVRSNRVHDNAEITVPGQHTDGNGIIIDWNRNEDGRAPAYRGPTLIEGNTCWRNGGKGIHAYLSDAVTIRRNTCWNNNLDTKNPGTARAEISLHESSDSTVEGNISLAVKGSGILANNSSAMNQGQRNVWRDNCLAGGLGWMDAGTGPTAATGNIFVDPQFTDAANGDFSLGAGSPATGKGAVQTIPEPEDDDMEAVIAALQAFDAQVSARLAALEARPTDPEIAARVAQLEAEIAALKAFDQKVKDL